MHRRTFLAASSAAMLVTSSLVADGAGRRRVGVIGHTGRGNYGHGLDTVCPRHPDQHLDMMLAAIESGAKGIYCEKPFCRTPAEADALIAAAEKHGTQVAVAHRNRYQPTLAHTTDLVGSGEMGWLLETRGKGKGDRRGGGKNCGL